MRAAILAVALFAPSTAAADDLDVSPQVWLGYRHLVGFADYSGPSAGLGLRASGGQYSLELAIANLQLDSADGQHTAARVSAGVAPVDRTWLTAGMSYGWAQVFVDAPLPNREGGGIQLELGARHDLLDRKHAKAFLQLGITVPLYTLRDIYGSEDDDRRLAAIELALGVGF